MKTLCERILSLLILAAATVATDRISGIIYRTDIRVPAKNVSDLYKRTTDFIEKHGYLAETHMVTTEDGYILTLHRIPRGKTEFVQNSSASRPVVILQHGMAGASDNWVMNGRKSFPFMLSDVGFDVWLPDTRGSSYSRGHVNFTSDDPKYWNFSFHEQGYYDMAAIIDYSISVSGQKKVFYLGHSRGTTMAWVLLSTRPEYNEKIELVLAFAPVAYLKHAKGPALKAFFNHTTPQELTRFARRARFFAFPGMTNNSLMARRLLCGSVMQPICTHTLFLFMGFDYDLMNNSMVPVYLSHFPYGGGLNEFLHYLQIAKSDKFRQFDYGRIENQKRYGHPEPPKYPLHKITAPISMHYSDNDFFVSHQDLNHLIRELPSVVRKMRVPFKKFNHIDFILGTEAENLLYKPVINLMQEFL